MPDPVHPVAPDPEALALEREEQQVELRRGVVLTDPPTRTVPPVGAVCPTCNGAGEIVVGTTGGSLALRRLCDNPDCKDGKVSLSPARTALDHLERAVEELEAAKALILEGPGFGSGLGPSAMAAEVAGVASHVGRVVVHARENGA